MISGIIITAGLVACALLALFFAFSGGVLVSETKKDTAAVFAAAMALAFMALTVVLALVAGGWQ